MTTAKAAEVRLTPDQAHGEWLQVTPGERFRIRVASAQTMGAYSIIEIVADPGNGVPLHIHNKEEEHFMVLEGTLDIANGDRRWEAPAGTCVTVKRGVPHAWCNPSDTPLHMLVVFSPGQIDGLFRATAGRNGPIYPLAAEIASSLRADHPSVTRGWGYRAAGCLYETRPALTVFRSRTKRSGRKRNGNAFATIAL